MFTKLTASPGHAELDRRVLRSVATVLLVAACTSAAGCGPRTDRLEVSGEVSLDGKPLDQGSIRFTSTQSDQLLASGAMIQDGRFHISQKKGLRPGAYLLEIYSPDHVAPPVMMRQRPGGPGIPVAPERIPAQYNVDSQKTIEVTLDGDNHFVFDIASTSQR